MDVRNVKLPDKRFKVTDNKSLGVQYWGDNNLYPNELLRIISASSTASSCLKRYSKFIVGNGFFSELLANEKANSLGQTFDDIEELTGNDESLYGGWAVHINFDINCKAIEVQHVPFECCRLGLADKDGNVDKIAVFPDWSGSQYYEGKQLKPKKDNIKWINRFDPSKVFEQIPESGIEDYNGQILWYSNTGINSYPISKYDSGVTEISTDEGLANIAYRTVRSGFFAAGALIVKKGLTSDDQTGAKFQSDFVEKVEQLQGDQNLNKMIAFELDYDENEPKFIEFGGKNYDKDFTVTNENTVERIYAIFEQEAFYRIRNGSIGFNSEMIGQVYEYYSSVTGTERRQLERGFKRILDNWHKELNVDTSIEPLKYITNEQNNINS